MNKLIMLVQPGLGKSFITEKFPKKFLDFDIGSMRKYFLGIVEPVSERWRITKLYYPALFEMVSIAMQRYDVILLNEPSFAQYVSVRRPNLKFVTVVAYDAEDWIKRIEERDSASSFAELMKKNGKEWYPGWITKGAEIGSVEYLGPNEYLETVVDRLNIH